MKRYEPIGKGQQTRIGKKISALAHEKPSMPPKQRVAVAMNMARAGRITPSGGYRRKGD